jgi:outer membrane protein
MNKLLLVCLLFLAPVSLATADLKVGVVDLSKAFEEFYKTKDAQAHLKEKQDGYQKEIQDLVTDYQNMGQEAQQLDKQVNDPTLSPAAKADKQKALDQKKQDLVNLGNKIQEMTTERKREIQDELFRLHKQIVDEISTVVSTYSAPEGYDLVIDKSSASAASGVSIVLFSSSKLTDITPDIIKLLNKNAPATTTSSSPAAPADDSMTPPPSEPATTH